MKKFGLIGEKLGHSFSPMIHRMLDDYEYKLYEIPRNGLAGFMKSTELSGFNVTIPYKKEIIPYCSEISASAGAIGSVNTVIRKNDGSFFGDNTDYFGFEYLLDKSNVDISGKKVLVLGNGGASQTVQAVLKSAGAGSVTVISRNGDNNYGNLEKHRDAFAVVNTTPVGMYPDTGVSPIDLCMFPDCSLVIDLIYNPHCTDLLLQAENRGIPGFNGLPMLVAQAKKASELFTGKSIDDSEIDRISEIIRISTMNIALIGMPGSGKSTVARLLSGALNRPVVSIDKEIENFANMSIPDIFAGRYIPDKGGDIPKGLSPEATFRAIETGILNRVSKESGIIIDSGGGIVTVPGNRALLNRNSLIFCIHRPLKELDSAGRPLSKEKGISLLYKERKHLYEDWADYFIENTSPEKAAEEIISHLSALLF